MPEPRRVAIVLVGADLLTEALGLMKYGEITYARTDRLREGGAVFLWGDWSRGGQPPTQALKRESGEVARAVMLPPGLQIIEVWAADATSSDGTPIIAIKVEGAALPPVMPGQVIPRYTVEVDRVPQPADLPEQRRGRLVAA